MRIRRQGRDVGEIALTDIQEHRSIATIVKAPFGVKPGDKVYPVSVPIHPTRAGGKPLAQSDPAYKALFWLVSGGYVPSNSKLLVDGDKPVTADETGGAMGRAFSRFIEKGDVDHSGEESQQGLPHQQKD